MQVKDIMSKNVLTVQSNTTLASAVRIMLENRISGLPVVDKENRVISMITKSDILHLTLPSALRRTGSGEPSLVPKIEAFLARLKEVAGREVFSSMSRRAVLVAHPEMSVAEAAVLMFANEVRRLPVVDDEGSLQGIISYSDLTAIIAE